VQLESRDIEGVYKCLEVTHKGELDGDDVFSSEIVLKAAEGAALAAKAKK
jgi:hypothetical protein